MSLMGAGMGKQTWSRYIVENYLVNVSTATKLARSNLFLFFKLSSVVATSQLVAELMGRDNRFSLVLEDCVFL